MKFDLPIKMAVEETSAVVEGRLVVVKTSVPVKSLISL